MLRGTGSREGQMRSRLVVCAAAAVGVAALTAVAVTHASVKPAPPKPAQSAKPAHHRGNDPEQGQQNSTTGYAYVVPGEVSLNVAPVLVAQRTRNFVRVTSPAVGVYCLTPAPPINAATRSWTVSPEVSRSSVPSKLMFAYADAGGQPCSSSQVAVRTYELTGPSLTAVPSERVAFMLVT